MKMIIMGGSFNPPTIAHRALMTAALESLCADKGLYVPVSYAYLKRKMRRSGSTFCLSEAMRRQMLEAMCEGDERMAVCDLEYGTVAAATFDTMQKIQKEYPEAELYFLMGQTSWSWRCRWWNAETSSLVSKLHCLPERGSRQWRRSCQTRYWHPLQTALL